MSDGRNFLFQRQYCHGEEANTNREEVIDVLTGGLTPSDGLFNVRGSSGTLSIASGSLFQGPLLAYNSSSSAQRTLTVSGANTLANGELIANKVIVSSGAHVQKPKKMSRDDDDEDDHHR